MAIVKMKRLTLLAMRSDRDRLLTALQRMGCLEISDMPEDCADYAAKADEKLEHVQSEMDRISQAIGKLKKYDVYFLPKPFSGLPEVTAAEADQSCAEENEIFGDIAQIEEYEHRMGEIRGLETRVKSIIEQYEPWEALDATADDLFHLRTARFFTGAIQSRNLPALDSELSGLPAAMQIVSQVRDKTYLCIAAHPGCLEKVSAALEQAEYTVETFQPLEGRTPRDFIAFQRGLLSRMTAEQADIEKRLSQIAGRIPRMKILYAVLLQERKRLQAAAHFAATDSVFLLRGWIPAESTDATCEKLRAISPSVTVELRDPEDSEEPPVQLRNCKFAAAFEPVVASYSLPAYRGVDPTFVMAPFFVNLFGLMLSDAGYGLIMALAIPIFMKIRGIQFKNARMLWLLTWGGVFTILWGLVLNTVFGFAPVPYITSWMPLSPIEQSLPVMGMCIGFGAIHLFAGLGMNIYKNIRNGDILGAIGGPIAWVCLIAGIFAYALGSIMALPVVGKIGLGSIAFGVLSILLFTKRGTKNPIKRILGGLGALYGISGWISDLLSYMRLFGMGLATGVIGIVFNMLIGIVWNAGIIGKVIGAVLFVGCHAFNLGINALGAYVHSCRLQYIEFFGKFFEDGGRPFAPLDDTARYVSIARVQSEP